MSSQKCIWMEAGAVDYQLCPLHHNCDQCDFYARLTHHGAGSLDRESSEPVNLSLPDIENIPFTPGFQYIDGHFWYRQVAAGRIRLGLDHFLWQLFTPPRKVVMPVPGTHLSSRQCLTWLQFNEMIVYIRAPFSGKIIQTNPLFDRQSAGQIQPALAPLEDLWFVELQLKTPGEKIVLNKADFFQINDRNLEKLKRLLTNSEVPALPLQKFQLEKQILLTYLQSISNNQIFIC